MTIALTESSTTEVPARRRQRLADRHPVALFTTLAFALSWWPAIGRFGNPESAVVIPIGPSIAGTLVIGWQRGATAWASWRELSATPTSDAGGGR